MRSRRELLARLVPGALVFATAIVFGLPCPVRAEDGVTAINQARAMAGGVTLGDAPGFPVTIDEPGSYRLTGNLDVSGEATPADVTAISITASHVTLDLNGFAVLGATTCSGPPPTCFPTGAGRGVDAGEAADVAVTNGSVHGMGSDGIRLGDRSVVRHVMVRENAAAGIHIGEFGMAMGNVASFNGVGLDAGFGSVVAGNASSYNGGSGLVLAQGSVAQGNATSFNFTDGVLAGSGSVLRGNASYSNGGFGLSLMGSSGFADNVLVDNDDGTDLGGLQVGENLCGSDTTCP